MKRSIRAAAARFPLLYCTGARLRRGRNREVVSRRTSLLVESFPRSGTTYLVAALQIVCPTLRVASHVHHIAHIRRAVRLAVPGVVVMRDPIGASASLAIYDGVPAGAAQLRRWIALHDRLAALPQIKILKFDDLTKQPEAALTGVLALADREPDFLPADLEEYVNRRIDEMTVRRHGHIDSLRVSRPTIERADRKTIERMRLLDREPLLIRRAREIHDVLVERAIVPAPVADGH